MSENKTQQTDASVETFLSKLEDKVQQEDSRVIIKLMEEATKEKPAMWGPAIIGFGNVHYKYESGREGDMPRIGFSPRKGTLALYVINGDYSLYSDLFSKLGKHKTGKVCLYVKRLADIDMDVLKQIITRCLSN